MHSIENVNAPLEIFEPIVRLVFFKPIDRPK